jgi:hypothetical protein
LRPHFNGRIGVLDRPTLKKPSPAHRDEPDAGSSARSQSNGSEARFVLRVDGQPKRSFDDREAALRAGREIKTSFPVVVVSVLDTAEGGAEVVEPK